MAFPIPFNEPQRLAALRALEILDTGPEIAYDEIAGLAAQACSAVWCRSASRWDWVSAEQ
jgi:hypothetical protein